MPGRFEVLGYQPLVVIDGAHNPAGADTCAQVFFDDFNPDGRRILVVGTLREPTAMLEALRADEFDVVVACTAPSPRGVPVADVARAARRPRLRRGPRRRHRRGRLRPGDARRRRRRRRPRRRLPVRRRRAAPRSACSRSPPTIYDAAIASSTRLFTGLRRPTRSRSQPEKMSRRRETIRCRVVGRRSTKEVGTRLRDEGYDRRRASCSRTTQTRDHDNGTDAAEMCTRTWARTLIASRATVCRPTMPCTHDADVIAGVSRRRRRLETLGR